MTHPAPPSPEQADDIRHSLGLNTPNVTVPYRNHYCACVDNSEHMEAMVEAGWMRRGKPLNGGRDRYYHVTPAGAAAIGTKLR